jgi:hypothetical protein
VIGQGLSRAHTARTCVPLALYVDHKMEGGLGGGGSTCDRLVSAVPRTRMGDDQGFGRSLRRILLVTMFSSPLLKYRNMKTDTD